MSDLCSADLGWIRRICFASFVALAVPLLGFCCLGYRLFLRGDSVGGCYWLAGGGAPADGRSKTYRLCAGCGALYAASNKVFGPPPACTGDVMVVLLAPSSCSRRRCCGVKTKTKALGLSVVIFFSCRDLCAKFVKLLSNAWASAPFAKKKTKKPIELPQ